MRGAARFTLRAGPTPLALIFGGPALADVCETLRPGWDGTAQTGFAEAIHHLSAPTGLFLLGATAVAMLFRHSIGVAIACVMWAFYVTSVIMGGDAAQRAAGMAEGCLANPALFVGLAAAICGVAVFLTYRREKRL